MGWASQKEVLKHYRILTKREASFRQFMLAVSVSLVGPLFIFVSKIAYSSVLYIAVSYLIFTAFDSFGNAPPPTPAKSEGEGEDEKGAASQNKETEKAQPSASESQKTPGSNGGSSLTETEAADPSTEYISTQSSQAAMPATSADAGPQVEAPYVGDPADTRLERLRLFLTSDKYIMQRRICLAGLLGALPVAVVIKMPILLLLAVSFIMELTAAHLGVAQSLSFIEGMDIDEFPVSLRDRTLLNIRKTFAYSRGYYFLGEVNGKPVGLPRLLRFLHTLIGGPTGEGKSSTLIVPPLLFDADSPGSAVVPDAKSPELFSMVSGRWINAGKKAYLFDPWHPDSIAINPLLGAEDQDLLTICDVMMREREEAIGKEDAFFKSRTRYLLYAMLKLVQSFKPQFCNLATVYKICESVSTLQKFIDTVDEDIAFLFDDFSELNPETRVNALTSIREKLDVFMQASVRKAFSKGEFQLKDLFTAKEPCLLVLGCPINQKEAGTKIASLIVNLIINRAFDERRMMKVALQKGETAFVPNDLYLYLDELRNLKVTGLPDLISIARETRTQVCASVTDLGFLKYYKDDYSSLMSNFRVRLYMKGLDYDSAKYISDSLGKERIPQYRMFKGLMIGQENVNLSDPDRVMNMPEDKIIVFNPKTRPFVADKVSIYKSRWLKKMQAKPPEAPRKLYEQWGKVTGPLEDPVLPELKKGEYDMKQIKGDHKVKVNKSINVDKIHRERIGGGTFRRPSVDNIMEVQEEGYQGSFDEEVAMVDDGGQL